MIDTRRRRVFRLLWNEGRLSRSELHRRTGLTPNGVGTLAEAMLREGLVRECRATETPAVRRSAAGRPRVPLEIDPDRRHVVGLALMPGQVEICHLGLAGNLVDRVHARKVADADELIPTAAKLLKEHIDQRTIGIGMSVTGFVDPRKRTLLFSSATRGGEPADLSPIIDAAGEVPIVIENDMHALAARWLLTHRADHEEDMLIVRVGDGSMGAALLVDGRPNRGCAPGGNELGHTRFFVDTEKCFCGHTGCLERIVSSVYLAKLDKTLTHNGRLPRGLAKRVEQFESMEEDPSLQEITRHLALALSNAVNFVRPHRLVLTSPLIRESAYGDALVRLTRSMVLPQLVDRVRVDRWHEPGIGADTSAWLALAELLYGGWHHTALSGTALASA